MTNELTGLPFDLTGRTLAGKIRRKFSDALALADFAITIIGAHTAGRFDVDLTPTQTAALSPVSASDIREELMGVFDIEMTLGAAVERIVEGPVILSQEATKPNTP